MLLVMKLCLSWTGSAPQFALKQLALQPHIEAKVKEGTGEVTDGAHQERRVAKSTADEDVVLDANANQVHTTTTRYISVPLSTYG